MPKKQMSLRNSQSLIQIKLQLNPCFTVIDGGFTMQLQGKEFENDQNYFDSILT